LVTCGHVRWTGGVHVEESEDVGETEAFIRLVYAFTLEYNGGEALAGTDGNKLGQEPSTYESNA
jgi:hypothetical protein